MSMHLSRCSETTMTNSCGYDLLYARIDSNRIWYLKFILEGYDGLAILSTENKDEGIIRLSVYRSRYTELILILDAIAGKIMRRNKISSS